MSEQDIKEAAPTVAGYISLIPKELPYLLAVFEKPPDDSFPWWIKTDAVQALVHQRDELLEAAKGMIDMPADTPEFFHARARLRSAVEEAE